MNSKSQTEASKQLRETLRHAGYCNRHFVRYAYDALSGHEDDLRETENELFDELLRLSQQFAEIPSIPEFWEERLTDAAVELGYKKPGHGSVHQQAISVISGVLGRFWPDEYSTYLDHGVDFGGSVAGNRDCYEHRFLNNSENLSTCRYYEKAFAVDEDWSLLEYCLRKECEHAIEQSEEQADLKSTTAIKLAGNTKAKPRSNKDDFFTLFKCALFEHHNYTPGCRPEDMDLTPIVSQRLVEKGIGRKTKISNTFQKLFPESRLSGHKSYQLICDDAANLHRFLGKLECETLREACQGWELEKFKLAESTA